MVQRTTRISMVERSPSGAAVATRCKLRIGRAATPADAIMLHAGQGAAAAADFQLLSLIEQQQLLDFLNAM